MPKLERFKRVHVGKKFEESIWQVINFTLFVLGGYAAIRYFYIQWLLVPIFGSCKIFSIITVKGKNMNFFVIDKVQATSTIQGLVGYYCGLRFEFFFLALILCKGVFVFFVKFSLLLQFINSVRSGVQLFAW